MRALRVQNGELVLRDDAAEPVLRDGEAMLRPVVMGVCSTDLELCRGYMEFEGTLGHEFVAVVEAVKGSKEQQRQWVGQRVVGGINAVCGTCDLCRQGLSAHCRKRTVLGIAGRDGCFAERFTLPIDNLVAVPEGLADEAAVFAEPLAAAIQVTRQVAIERRPYITVLGDGRLGLLCAQVLSQFNATVRVLGRHDEHLTLCEKWGIPARQVNEAGRLADQDIVVDATGSASGLPTAVGMVRPRGTVVLKTTLAERKGGPAVDAATLAQIVVSEITVVGSRCGPMDAAIAMLAAGEVEVGSMVSATFGLARGREALMAAARPGVLKVLLTLRG